MELKEQCLDGCNVKWLTLAKDVLKNNGVYAHVFEAAFRDLL